MENPLEQYMKKYCTDIAKFAAKIKVSRPTVYSALKGKKVSNDAAAKIEKGTNGEVTCVQLADYSEYIREKMKALITSEVSGEITLKKSKKRQV